MVVNREAFSELLADTRARCPLSPGEGLFGPHSATWKISRESIIFLGGGSAALLQLAHPYVAHGVDQHSKTRNDPIGRFNRTFMHVFSIVFGDREQAFDSARRVHNIHRRIEGPIGEDVGCFAKGHVYRANDEQALLWVHATLIHTALQVHDLILGPLDSSMRDRYYEESKEFAHLFGIGANVLPPTLRDFERYVQSMVDSTVLAVGTPAAEMGRFLMSAPNPASRPFVRWYRTMTAGLLPPRFREAFGLRFGRRERLLFASSVRGLRATYPYLPRRLRYLPAYVEAVRRLSGQEGPDRFGRAIERFVLFGITPTKPAAGCPVSG